MGPIGCPETSVRNYYYALRNNPEERSSQPKDTVNRRAGGPVKRALTSPVMTSDEPKVMQMRRPKTLTKILRIEVALRQNI